MEQDTIETLVIFRAEKSGKFKGQVTAIFPELGRANPAGDFQVFDTQSGHGAGSREWWWNHTRPATPEEYEPTRAALVNLYGYRLKIRNRWNRSRRA